MQADFTGDLREMQTGLEKQDLFALMLVDPPEDLGELQADLENKTPLH